MQLEVYIIHKLLLSSILVLYIPIPHVYYTYMHWTSMLYKMKSQSSAAGMIRCSYICLLYTSDAADE